MTLADPSAHSLEPQRIAAVRPASAVIADWERAGAVFGWISIDRNGDWRFDEGKPAAWPAFRSKGFDQDESPEGALPAFRLNGLLAGPGSLALGRHHGKSAAVYLPSRGKGRRDKDENL